MINFDKKKLLEIMVNVILGKGIVEYESDNENLLLKNFLFVDCYCKILNIDIFLILGGRGVGKIEFFCLLGSFNGCKVLVKNLKIKYLFFLEKIIWIVGYGYIKIREKNFFVLKVIEDYMKDKDRSDWCIFWIGLVLGVIF